MKNFFAFVTLAVSQALASDPIIMAPAAEATGDDVAIVWIHGMQCDNAGYQDFASKI